MKYAVNAMSIDPRTGEKCGEPRTEIIDTDTNVLFAGATGPWDVEDRYAAFWNRLNDSWEARFPAYKDKVIVISVSEATQ